MGVSANYRMLPKSYKNSGLGRYFGGKYILLYFRLLSENGRKEISHSFVGAIITDYFLNPFFYIILCCFRPWWLGNNSPKTFALGVLVSVYSSSYYPTNKNKLKAAKYHIIVAGKHFYRLNN